MATSRQIDKQRAVYKRTETKLRAEAVKASKAGEKGYAKVLVQQADEIAKTINKSYVGRSGNAQQRQEKIDRSATLLSNRTSQLMEAREAMTKEGKARLKQEQAFAASRKLNESRNVKQYGWKGVETISERPVTSAFYSATQDLWRGAKTPQERNRLIVKGLGVSSIGEAYNKVIPSSTRESDALLARNWRSLSRQGWSKDDIELAKAYDAKGKLYEFWIQRFGK